MKPQLTLADFQAAATTLAVAVAAVRAVTEVESNGSGFFDDGRVVVQYEPHIMYRQLRSKFGVSRANAELAKHPDLVAMSAGSYQRKEREDADMDRAAREIDRDCSLESASWGLFQIMGYHWKTCGYASLQAFLNDIYRSSAGQLNVFVQFILADPRLLDALRKRDWIAFAKTYNGPGYAANKYDAKLAVAFARYS